MATVLRVGRFRVAIYGPPREHPPPHVHVECGSGVVIVRLGTGAAPPVLWAVHGVNDREALRAFRLVEEHHELLRNTWRAFHGQGPTL